MVKTKSKKVTKMPKLLPEPSFVMDGYRWPTLEHYVRAQDYPAGGETYMKILRSETRKEIRSISAEESPLYEHTTDWYIDVVDRGLDAQLRQNPEWAEQNGGIPKR